MDGQKMEETKETKRRLQAYLEYCLTQRYLGILKRIYEENYTVMAMRIERILENGESTQILQDRMVRLTEEHKRGGRSDPSPKDSGTERKGRHRSLKFKMLFKFQVKSKFVYKFIFQLYWLVYAAFIFNSLA